MVDSDDEDLGSAPPSGAGGPGMVDSDDEDLVSAPPSGSYGSGMEGLDDQGGALTSAADAGAEEIEFTSEYIEGLFKKLDEYEIKGIPISESITAGLIGCVRHCKSIDYKQRALFPNLDVLCVEDDHPLKIIKDRASADSWAKYKRFYEDGVNMWIAGVPDTNTLTNVFELCIKDTKSFAMGKVLFQTSKGATQRTDYKTAGYAYIKAGGQYDTDTKISGPSRHEQSTMTMVDMSVNAGDIIRKAVHLGLTNEQLNNLLNEGNIAELLLNIHEGKDVFKILDLCKPLFPSAYIKPGMGGLKGKGLLSGFLPATVYQKSQGGNINIGPIFLTSTDDLPIPSTTVNPIGAIEGLQTICNGLHSSFHASIRQIIENNGGVINLNTCLCVVNKFLEVADPTKLLRIQTNCSEHGESRYLCGFNEHFFSNVFSDRFTLNLSTHLTDELTEDTLRLRFKDVDEGSLLNIGLDDGGLNPIFLKDISLLPLLSRILYYKGNKEEQLHFDSNFRFELKKNQSNISGGIWILDGKELTLNWYNGDSQKFNTIDRCDTFTDIGSGGTVLIKNSEKKETFTFPEFSETYSFDPTVWGYPNILSDVAFNKSNTFESLLETFGFKVRLPHNATLVTWRNYLRDHCFPQALTTTLETHNQRTALLQINKSTVANILAVLMETHKYYIKQLNAQSDLKKMYCKINPNKTIMVIDLNSNETRAQLLQVMIATTYQEYNRLFEGNGLGRGKANLYGTYIEESGPSANIFNKSLEERIKVLESIKNALTLAACHTDKWGGQVGLYKLLGFNKIHEDLFKKYLTPGVTLDESETIKFNQLLNAFSSRAGQAVIYATLLQFSADVNGYDQKAAEPRFVDDLGKVDTNCSWYKQFETEFKTMITLRDDGNDNGVWEESVLKCKRSALELINGQYNLGVTLGNPLNGQMYINSLINTILEMKLRGKLTGGISILNKFVDVSNRLKTLRDGHGCERISQLNLLPFIKSDVYLGNKMGYEFKYGGNGQGYYPFEFKSVNFIELFLNAGNEIEDVLQDMVNILRNVKAEPQQGKIGFPTEEFLEIKILKIINDKMDKAYDLATLYKICETIMHEGRSHSFECFVCLIVNDMVEEHLRESNTLSEEIKSYQIKLKNKLEESELLVIDLEKVITELERKCDAMVLSFKHRQDISSPMRSGYVKDALRDATCDHGSLKKVEVYVCLMEHLYAYFIRQLTEDAGSKFNQHDINNFLHFDELAVSYYICYKIRQASGQDLINIPIDITELGVELFGDTIRGEEPTEWDEGDKYEIFDLNFNNLDEKFAALLQRAELNIDESDREIELDGEYDRCVLKLIENYISLPPGMSSEEIKKQTNKYAYQPPTPKRLKLLPAPQAPPPSSLGGYIQNILKLLTVINESLVEHLEETTLNDSGDIESYLKHWYSIIPREFKDNFQHLLENIDGEKTIFMAMPIDGKDNKILMARIFINIGKETYNIKGGGSLKRQNKPSKKSKGKSPRTLKKSRKQLRKKTIKRNNKRKTVSKRKPMKISKRKSIKRKSIKRKSKKPMKISKKRSRVKKTIRKVKRNKKSNKK